MGLQPAGMQSADCAEAMLVIPLHDISEQWVQDTMPCLLLPGMLWATRLAGGAASRSIAVSSPCGF